MQNHNTELILNYNQDKDQITSYFQKLIEPLKKLNPMIFYIYQNDIEHIFNKTIEERRTDQPNKYRDWIDEVILYLGSTKFAKTLNFLGKEGMIRYGEYRQDMEQKVMKKLGAVYKVFELDRDYNKVFEQMKHIEI